jgi:hypothetical protein
MRHNLKLGKPNVTCAPCPLSLARKPETFSSGRQTLPASTPAAATSGGIPGDYPPMVIRATTAKMMTAPTWTRIRVEAESAKLRRPFALRLRGRRKPALCSATEGRALTAAFHRSFGKQPTGRRGLLENEWVERRALGRRNGLNKKHERIRAAWPKCVETVTPGRNCQSGAAQVAGHN